MRARRGLLSGGGGLRLGQLPIGPYTAPTIIVLEENGTGYDHILIQHSYPAAGSGASLVLRNPRDMSTMPFGSSGEEYASSTIATTVGNTARFSAGLVAKMASVSLPLASGSLSAKRFLLSAWEMGFSSADVQGPAIPFFSSAAARKRDYDYWTRQKNSGASFYFVDDEGYLGSGRYDLNKYVRPVVALLSSLPVTESGGKYYPVL